MPEPGASAEGVGLAYHPFLHDAILAQLDAFDFIELPLDLYLDPAQSALLDPGLLRLREIAAARPCVWHGSALSLGSVEAPDDPAPDSRQIGRIRQLMVEVPTTRYSDVIGFRRLAGRDLGLPQGLPYTEAAAHWVAARYAAARTALGQPFLLQLSAASLPAPRTRWDAAAFLDCIAATADCDFALDAADLPRLATEAATDPVGMASRLPGGRIATLVASGSGEEDWALLSLLLRTTAARSVVIRRTRNLFPLDAILCAVRRAGELLAERRERAPRAWAADVPVMHDSDGLAGLRAYQQELIDDCLDPAPGRTPSARTALAMSVRSWHTWRARVEDTYKAQQIAQFLARDTRG